MSQIKTKFITDNAVTDLKQRLRNNQPLRARNAADSGDVNVMKVDASDIVQLLVQTQIATAPSAANDVVNKTYVDAIAQGLKWKAPVRALSSADITLSAPQTIDGVSVIAGDRVLVAGQTAGEDNGIYLVAAGAWTRTTDADASSEILQMAVFVEEGSLYADTAWVCSTDAPITLGTTPLTFVQFSSTGTILAGAGLTKTGNTIDAVAGDASILVGADSFAVQNDSAGAIVTSGSGIKVNLETSNPSLQISTNKLGAKLDGAGSIVSGASGLAVQLESSNPTLQIATNKLGVKLDAAGAIITGASGIKSQVDGATIKIASNSLQGLIPTKENLTLNGTDITNQYKDLAHTVAPSSLNLSVDGVMQYEGTDYTLSTVSSVTRITFTNDLATGGGAALISGDILRAQYMYL